jgi:basic amino acid/polyamine antiporter, APA family
MAQRRLHGLERVLGVNALFSTAYGNVGSSIYYALGLVASFALGLTPVVFVIAGVIFFLTAATYAEATAMYPEAGGSSSFARHAFNEFWSFFAAWGQMLNYVITISISAFFVPHYVGSLFWEPLRHAPGDIIAGIVVVAVLAVINVFGVKEAARLNILLAVTDFATQLLLVLLGLVLVFSPETLIDNIQLGVAPTWKDFVIAIPVAMIAYTGIETISNMAEEARDEATTIPRAINRVVIAVFAIYALLPAVALSALPVTQNADGSHQTLLGLPEDQGGYAGDPVLGIVKSMDLGPLQGVGEVYVGLLAATILFIATNAGIIGVSRLVYSMGIHRQVPDRLRQLHPRFRTPWLGILVFSGVACIAMLPGRAAFLGNMYAFGAMLSFTIAHAAVVRLRVKQPDRERPYRGPGTLRLGGRELPLFALAGGLGTGLAWVTVTVLHLDVALTGIGWLAFGMALYAVYRRRQGLDLTTTTRVAVPKPVVDHEAEYESVLVAFDEREYVPEVLATAIRLAARRSRGIHVLVTITVPATSPINAALPEQELAAQEVIEQAKVQGGRRVTGHWLKVRAGQAGRAIVDEAREIGARAIVMPMPERAGGGSIFGRTLETVLAERPCRVIIESVRGRRVAPVEPAAA